MTDGECLAEVKKLEVSLMRFAPRTAEDIDFWDRRRDAIFESVEQFDLSTLREAFKKIVEATEDDDKGYFPTVPEIVRTCREVESTVRGRATRSPRARYRPAEHTCSTEKPNASVALGSLALLFPYEAKHILCPADVKATCPVCGARKMETGALAGFIELFKEETAGWTTNFKGLRVCPKCEKKL